MAYNEELTNGVDFLRFCFCEDTEPYFDVSRLYLLPDFNFLVVKGL